MSTTASNKPQPAQPPPKPSESVWSKLISFFKHAGVAVSDVLAEIFGSDAAHTFATGAETLLDTALGKIAMTAVTSAQSLASNQEKFATAASQIGTEAKAQGIAVSDSIINMLIELCVQKVKGTFGTPATAS